MMGKGDASPGEKAKQTALRILARRDQSEAELKKKLKRRGYEDKVIAGLLDEFRELGYIDDQACAMRQVRYLAREKWYGNRRIEAHLMERGLPREQIRQAIAEVRRELPEAEALEQYLAGKEQGLIDPGGKRRLFQRLLGKGFPPGLIYEKLDTMAEVEVHDDDGE